MKLFQDFLQLFGNRQPQMSGVLQNADTLIGQVEEDHRRAQSAALSQHIHCLLYTSTWADLYAGSSIEGKKMILRQLIDRVNIGKNFEIEVELNISVVPSEVSLRKESVRCKLNPYAYYKALCQQENIPVPVLQMCLYE